MYVEKNIWHQLKKPILALAPMEDVTDTVFRQIVASCGRPDVFFTEFTNSTGIFIQNKQVMQRLCYTETERPLIAQIWGVTPDHYFQAAQEIVKLGFDGIDINMGCPIDKIIKKGSCSALIKNHPLAQEIIKATQDGASGLPVSVKTRIGFDQIVTEEWISFLMEQNLQALTIHGRTVKEKSRVPNHWEEIAKAVTLRKQKKAQTILLGNGDITTLSEAHEKIKNYELDGIMIGRAIFDNPWIFNSQIDLKKITEHDRLSLFATHLSLYQKTWGDTKNFATLKKFVKTYVKNFEHAPVIRQEIMESKNYDQLKQILEKAITQCSV